MRVTAFTMRHFVVRQEQCGMKVTTDGVAFGALATSWMTAPRSVLDIGTGTGVLALMTAQRFSAARIDAVEVDESAAGQARDNAGQFSNIRVRHGDVRDLEGSYDTILCNPPFFENHRPSPDARRSLARHDLPATDLLDAVERLLANAGFFYVLLSAKHKAPRRQFEQHARDRGLRLRRAAAIADRRAKRPHAVALAFQRGGANVAAQETRLDFFLPPPGGDDATSAPGWRPLTDDFRTLVADFYRDELLQ